MIRTPLCAAAGTFAGIVSAPHLAGLLSLAYPGTATASIAVACLASGAVLALAAGAEWVVHKGSSDAIDDWSEAVATRERIIVEREQRAAAQEGRLHDLLNDVQAQAYDIAARRDGVDARAAELAAIETAHRQAKADLDQRRAEFDSLSALTIAAQAQAVIERQRIELRDERAALAGERIALDAARTEHAAQVRASAFDANHAALVATPTRDKNRTRTVARAAKRQGSA